MGKQIGKLFLFLFCCFALAFYAAGCGSQGGPMDFGKIVSTPSISHISGIYSSAISVTLECSDPTATIKYTTDGTEPIISSISYSGPVIVSATETLKARAYNPPNIPSPIAVATYEITGTVATPTFSPDPGTYSVAQSVTLSCLTPSTIIRYTRDGATPNSTSTRYSLPLTISSSTILKSIAYLSDWTNSSVGVGTYEITGKIPTPEMSLSGGTYSVPQTLTLECSMTEAAIKYTTNGVDPTSASSTYVNPLTISASQTVKAKAFRTGWDASDITTESFVIAGTVATPTFSPDPGIYSVAKSVALSCLTTSTTIRYTTDGSTPNPTSNRYLSPIAVPSTTTLKAIAYLTDLITSDVGVGTYEITGKVPTPEMSVPGGTYSVPQTLTLECSMTEAAIKYTTDGTNPTLTSSTYVNPLTISTSQTIEAKAFRTGWDASDITTESFVITGTVATPTFSPHGGTYILTPEVTISCSTGADIRYTLDGTEPTETSPLYSTPVPVRSFSIFSMRNSRRYPSATSVMASPSGPSPVTLTAKAFKSGWISSQSTAESYTTSLQIMTVDSPGNVGKYPSIVLDNSNNPQVVYYDNSNTALKYAYWNVSTWIVGNIVDSSVGLTGGDNSLAIDSSNNLYVAYMDGNTNSLKFREYTGGGWTAANVITTECKYPSIAVDPSGTNAYVTYYDYNSGNIVYTTCEVSVPGTWTQTATMSAGSDSLYSNSSVGVENNTVHVAYFDNTNQIYCYKTLTPSGFSSYEIATGSAGKVSLAFDSNTPANEYVSFTGNILYSRSDGETWSSLLSSSNINPYSSVKIDSNGKYTLSSYDSSGRVLKYLSNSSGSDVVYTLDSSADVGMYCSTAIDSNGKFHIVYYDRTNGDLKYATNK